MDIISKIRLQKIVASVLLALSVSPSLALENVSRHVVSCPMERPSGKKLEEASGQ